MSFRGQLVGAALLPAILWGPPSSAGEVTAFVGATLVDTSAFGGSTRDLADAVVLVEGDRVRAVGPRGELKVPEGARRVDLQGGFLLPGFVDCFATQNNQAQANAHLAMGVTSFLDASDFRRGELYRDARPSPRVFGLTLVSGRSSKDSGPYLDPPALRAEMRRHAALGARALLLYYFLRPDQLAVVIEEARALGLATIGELGATSYAEAARAGVNAFVHTSRYALPLASDAQRARVAADPFGPPRTEFYRWLSALDTAGPEAQRHAAFLGGSGVALLPTLSLWYLDLPDHRNPWKEPVAAILDPKDIHLPADPATGLHQNDSWDESFALNVMRLETRSCAAGARYLAGSGCDVFGVLPGLGLHLELELLVRIGLTPRQAIAAATGNVPRVFGWREVGQLVPGSFADMLVFDANPAERIENLRSLRTVVLGGAVLDRKLLLTRP